MVLKFFENIHRILKAELNMVVKKKITIVFRVDASYTLGSGHVMRCLTLANMLRKTGHQCYFLMFEHPGNLCSYIKHHGYVVKVLSGNRPWSIETDLSLSTEQLIALDVDWLIVDHYEINRFWEKAIRPYCKKIMVIDDLLREHDCDLLLDQTLDRKSNEYQLLVPRLCKLLVGAQYVLLRPEFVELRDKSLKRRVLGNLNHLFIFMGGSNPSNATELILKTLNKCTLPHLKGITVVIGAQTLEKEEITKLASNMLWPTVVYQNIENMAQLMAASDFAIGAAGSASWERCCLGLPSCLLILANNQREVAQNLAQKNACFILENDDTFFQQMQNAFDVIQSDNQMFLMSTAAAKLVDGQGGVAVLNEMGVKND
jgi:UDP-2,4-diacetamido-2,4,6-trideoxy-beta-L-altropyranose hydrolase